jgi:alanine racemase
MPTAYINTNNLRANYQHLQSIASGKKIIAMVKANAYGHGILEVTRALPNADAFAVARLKDAILLRKNGIAQTILLLTGVFLEQDFILAAENEIDIVVHDIEHLQRMRSLPGPAKLNIWLKIDTGMHRLGFAVDVIPEILKEFATLPCVRQVKLMSHFASSENLSSQSNLQQIELFDKFTGLEKSFANSAALVNFPELQSQWARIGLLLYGVCLTQEIADKAKEFVPVMSLSAPIISIKNLRKGDKVGYGGVYECPVDMQVAIIEMGYGDGYPREISDAAYCLLGSVQCKIIGRVSMDLMSIALPCSASLGDEVEMWGENLPVTMVASWANTLPYTLLTRVNSSVERVIIE